MRSQPLTSARDGLEVVRVMEAVDRSLSLFGAPLWVKKAGIRHTETVGVPEDRVEVAADVALTETDEEAADREAAEVPTRSNGHHHGKARR
jgi:hypothetical protein